MERFWSKVEKTETCWNWRGAQNEQGYGRFRVGGETIGAHRFAFELEKGPLPAGLCALHNCDNSSCVRPDHLYAGTKKDNAEDREARGRSNHASGSQHGTSTHPGLHRGQRNGRSKLNEDQVRSIKRALLGGEKKASIARSYLVSKTVIGHISVGKLWPHVEV